MCIVCISDIFDCIIWIKYSIHSKAHFILNVAL